MTDLMSFYRGKRIFLTGHTGFKGAWLSRILLIAGAEVTGYALEPPTDPSLYEMASIGKCMTSVNGDVRDFPMLRRAFNAAQPEIVFHLAAQPIVRTSYEIPRETYEINVMGTVNLLECIRLAKRSVRSVLNVTTDKVYLNREREEGYREDEPLDGFDPYSNSKSCSELVTHSFYNSFFHSGDVAISTARAGNVIGGGDYARDRILPDCIRAASENRLIIVRNPYSIRPYQHVLDPLFAYLLIAQRQYEDPACAGWYNVGPDDDDCVTTGELVDLFCDAWGDGAHWEKQMACDAPHEASFLKLNCSKIKTTFGWRPKYHIDEAVEKTVDWTKSLLQGGQASELMKEQIEDYVNRPYA